MFKKSFVGFLILFLLFTGCQSISTRTYKVKKVGSIKIEVEGAYNQFLSGGSTRIEAVIPGSIPLPIYYESSGQLERVTVQIEEVIGAIEIKLTNVGNQGGDCK